MFRGIALVMLGVLLSSLNLSAEVLNNKETVVKRDVYYYLWLPDPKHVDNYVTQQSWLHRKFLDTKMEELNEICDFHIVDTNINKYYEQELIEPFSLRFGNYWIKSSAKLNTPEEYYKHLRYLILLDRFTVKYHRFTYRALLENERHRFGPFVYNRTIPNKELMIFPVPKMETDYSFEMDLQNEKETVFSKKKTVLSFYHSSDDRFYYNEFEAMDFNTGMLDEYIEKEYEKAYNSIEHELDLREDYYFSNLIQKKDIESGIELDELE